MIYKFEKEDGFKTIELFEYKDCLRIFTQEHKQEGVYIDLNKEDLFKLIGALHCIQKEIK
jgi:hypothetical protein